MRTSVIIALVCVLACSFATQTDKEAVDVLKKMEKSQFGRTILDTVQLQLAAGDPVQDLIHLLQDMEEKLEDEQDADDVFIEKLQAQCDEELAQLQAEIAEANARIEEIEEELAEKIPIRDQKVILLGEKQDTRRVIQARLVELDEHKALKDAEWAQEQEEHDKAQYVIQQAKEIILGAMGGGASFLQKKSMTPAAFAQLSDHFHNHAKKTVFKRKSLNAIFKLLGQISSSAPVQAESSAVERIVQLCDELLEKIAQSREIERRDYQHWVADYEQQKEQLNQKLDELNGEIAQLESEIETLNKRIQMLQEELAEQKERVRQKTEQHDERLQYCNDENVAYADRREKRDADREVVSDAIGLLQSKLRTFRQYVGDRVEGITRE